MWGPLKGRRAGDQSYSGGHGAELFAEARAFCAVEEDIKDWGSMGPGFGALLGREFVEGMSLRVLKFGLYLQGAGGRVKVWWERLASGVSINVNFHVCGGRWTVRVDTGRGNDGYCYRHPGEILQESRAKRGLVWESFGKVWD